MKSVHRSVFRSGLTPQIIEKFCTEKKLNQQPQTSSTTINKPIKRTNIPQHLIRPIPCVRPFVASVVAQHDNSSDKIISYFDTEKNISIPSVSFLSYLTKEVPKEYPLLIPEVWHTNIVSSILKNHELNSKSFVTPYFLGRDFLSVLNDLMLPHGPRVTGLKKCTSIQEYAQFFGLQHQEGKQQLLARIIQHSYTSAGLGGGHQHQHQTLSQYMYSCTDPDVDLYVVAYPNRYRSDHIIALNVLTRETTFVKNPRDMLKTLRTKAPRAFLILYEDPRLEELLQGTDGASTALRMSDFIGQLPWVGRKVVVNHAQLTSPIDVWNAALNHAVTNTHTEDHFLNRLKISFLRATKLDHNPHTATKNEQQAHQVPMTTGKQVFTAKDHAEVTAWNDKCDASRRKLTPEAEQAYRTKHSKYIILDLETTTKNLHGRVANCFREENRVVLPGLLDYNGNISIPNELYTAKSDMALPNLDPYDVIVGHNIKFDLLYLWKDPQLQRFLQRGGRIWDTMYAEYVLSGQRVRVGRGAGLDAIAPSYGGTRKIDLVKEAWKAGLDTMDIPIEMLSEYLAGDLYNTELVYEKQVQRSVLQGVTAIVEARMDALLCITNAEFQGISWTATTPSFVIKGEPLNDFIHPNDGKIHPEFSMCMTLSGVPVCKVGKSTFEDIVAAVGDVSRFVTIPNNNNTKLLRCRWTTLLLDCAKLLFGLTKEEDVAPALEAFQTLSKCSVHIFDSKLQSSTGYHGEMQYLGRVLLPTGTHVTFEENKFYANRNISSSVMSNYDLEAIRTQPMKAFEMDVVLTALGSMWRGVFQNGTTPHHIVYVGEDEFWVQVSGGEQEVVKMKEMVRDEMVNAGIRFLENAMLGRGWETPTSASDFTFNVDINLI
eukprot:PhF_6_TR11603/c0_g1_i1/m.18811